MFTLLLQATNAGTPADKTGEIDVNPTAIVEKLDNAIDGFIKLIPNIAFALIVLVLAFYVSRWLGGVVNRYLEKRERDNFGEILGSFLRWTLFLVGVGFAMTILSPNLTFADLLSGLGVSSVAIGFAFKDILQNWMAGLLILMRQPFEIGDEISVNGITGKVDRIETRATVITNYDGQQVVIPNSDIYTNAVKVVTANEYIRSQYDIGVGYDQDFDEAMEVARKALEGIAGINRDKPIDVLPWDQADSWLTIRIRWWTKSDRPTVVHTFARVILETQKAMDAAGIDLPFPTNIEVKDAHNIQEAQEREDKKAKIKEGKESE